MWKRSRKALQRLIVHLLLLVRDVQRFAGLPHAVALDGLREDHGGPSLVSDGRSVGVPDLDGIVAAAIEERDLVVGQVRDELEALRILSEEILARVRAALRLEILVLAVDRFLHALAQQTGCVAREQRIPAAAPDHLDHVPAGAEESGLEFLDDLAVAAHRPVEALQVAVDHEDEVVELFAHRHRKRAHRFRFVHLAVAEEAPDLLVGRLHELAVLEIAHEARLHDCLQWAEAHRNRRKLPEVRHQPGMRIGRKTLAADFLAEVPELFLGESSFEVSPCVEAGARMSLREDHVATVMVGRRAPEMVEADFVKRRGRGIGRDVSAVLRADAIRVDDHRDRIPANQRFNAPLESAIARIRLLARDVNRVDVGGVWLEGKPRAGATRVIDEPVEKEMCAVGAVDFQHRIDRLEPFPGFERIDVVALGAVSHSESSDSYPCRRPARYDPVCGARGSRLNPLCRARFQH